MQFIERIKRDLITIPKTLIAIYNNRNVQPISYL